MKLFIGLDVSSEKLDTCFLTDDDNLSILLEKSYTNDINGATDIKDAILQFSEEVVFQKIVIGMESTSIYSFHPAMFFQEDEELNELPLVVTVENPFRIKQFSRMFDEDKTDRIDAFRIADYLRLQRFSTSPLKEEKYVALQRLTRTRYQLVCQLTETKQHFLENLTYKCNTLTKELKNGEGTTSIFGSTMISLMTEDYSLDDFANMSLEDLGALLQSYGKGRFKHPEKIANSIKKAVRDSYRLGKVTQESIDIILACIVKNIQAVQKQIKILDKAIEDLVVIFPEYQSLRSIPGIGPVYAAGLLAEIGQIERFDNQAKLAKYAGLTWKVSQSGSFQSENTPLIKTGNRYFRYYLVEATNSVRMHLPEFKAYYQKKYKEVPKHQHKRAIVLTARKLVRLVDVLLRNHQLYTPPRSVIESK
ncbi:IS110 family transposase [Vagococcus carniphilus]|uniref:IS110 family transposase n=1 Tax=Vagococcus carniphilus TaxID=218144 RepID=UPI00288CFD8B|nr:IS110 family transposase [Vagococcus carniphilus]MDT2816219.1 IS110 family transposase [Vagococcus carniphilus]MDT2866528.1 IS110 family transposase [Vagococcus carniphilus]